MNKPKPDVNRLEAGNRLSVSERMKETKNKRNNKKMKRKAIVTIMMILFLASMFTVVFETGANPGRLLKHDDDECDLAYPAIHSGQYLRQRFRVSDFEIDDNCLVEEVQIFWYGADPDFTGVIKLRDHDTGDLVTVADFADIPNYPPGTWLHYDVSESGFVSDHFYVELWQTSPSPGGLIMGDTTDPQHMSEVSTDGGENWVVWSMFNFMIRVMVTEIPAGQELYYDDEEFDGLYYQIRGNQYLRQRFLLSDFGISEDYLVETVLISWFGTVPDFTGEIKLRDCNEGTLVTVSNLANIPTGSGPPDNWYNYYVAEAGFVSNHFYVELWQTNPSGFDFGGYIRTDLDAPQDMSETSYNSGETWKVSSTMNFMIRVTVKPLTPIKQMQILVETIETWNLPKGTENSLTSKLEEAIHLLNPNNEIGAVNKLLDFIHQVEVQTDKKLTSEQANYLIAEAQEIINKIQE